MIVYYLQIYAYVCCITGTVAFVSVGALVGAKSMNMNGEVPRSGLSI